jgi:hypothetical protein
VLLHIVIERSVTPVDFVELSVGVSGIRSVEGVGLATMFTSFATVL